MNLTGIHLGSYWMGKNDVVYLMAQELSRSGKVDLVDTQIYADNTSGWYREEILEGHTFAVRWIDDNKLKKLVASYCPDYLIVNAGGMAITKESSLWLRRRGVVSVGIELSDPDVFVDNGSLYSQYFDLYYTNSLYSLKAQYPHEAKYKWLPFAAAPTLHRPLPKVSKEYDVVVVGHARPDRVKVVNNLKKYFKVGTFGNGWGSDSLEVHGESHVRAINSGKIYLSFAQTYAGYNNVKVGFFEAAACKTCILTAFTEEMPPLFSYGIDVVGYNSESSLLKAIRYYLHNPTAREWIAENSYRRTLREHTWEIRWKEVLRDVTNIKKSRRA